MENDPIVTARLANPMKLSSESLDPTPAVTLGATDITLEKPMGIGTMQWGRTWLDGKLNRGGNLPDATCREIFHVLRSYGIQFFDTAEGYGGGTSEERLGDLLAWEREEQGRASHQSPTIIGTKFLPHLARWTSRSLSRALRSSNSRLGLQASDIYFIHTPVHPMPLEHWVAAAAKEANKGNAKAIGLSNCNADQVRRACAEAELHGQHVACNQIMFNLLCYGSPALRETEEACRELGVTIIAYSPIGQGLLTRNLTQEKFKTIRVAKMAGIGLGDLDPLRCEVARLAEHHGKSMAQVCLNWVICHGAVPLVGCRSLEQAHDSAGALGWRLSAEEVEGLDAVALSMSTLAKPRWRRGLFVVFISLLMLSYKASMAFEVATSTLSRFLKAPFACLSRATVALSPPPASASKKSTSAADESPSKEE